MDNEKLLLYKDEIEQLTYLFRKRKCFKQVESKLKIYGVKTKKIFLVAKTVGQADGEEYGVILSNENRIFTYFLLNETCENVSIKEIHSRDEGFKICPQLRAAFYIISRI